MPRPLSWLPRLHTIRRTVAGSARSHYGRRELERLFELQPRAAGKLLELLPTVQVGTSRLVEREPLLALLDHLQEADDPGAVLAEARSRATAPSRRSLRQLVPQDLPPATWETLPASLGLEPGGVTITYRRLEELAGTLAALASLLEAHLEGFAERYEVPYQALAPAREEGEDLSALFEELKALEAQAEARTRNGGTV